MPAQPNDAPDGIKVIARNRKARHEYFIEQTFEAGIELKGTEVKSLRDGKATLNDAYARVEKGELWLINCHINEYTMGNRFNHDPLRKRRLLMHRREIHRLFVKTAERGYTLVVLSLYFVRGRAKAELGLAKGKKMYDRRETIKQRDIRRAQARGDD